MDNKNIEDIAVNAICQKFERSKVISTFISSNDKEPLWDGHLYIYKNEGNRRNNKSLIGRIASQIKGKVVKNFKVKGFKFSIGTLALKNYRRDGGLIFFVVQITDCGKKIFYQELTPVNIANILKMHAGQASVSLTFMPFPDDLSKCETILVELLGNLNKQSVASINEPLDFDDLKKLKPKGLSFVFATNDNSKSPFELLVEKPIYLYATFGNGMPDVPLSNGPFILSTARTINEAVQVNGVTYYNEYRNTLTKDNVIINIDNVLVITIDQSGQSAKSKVTISFDVKDRSLSNVINALSFIKALIESREIEIGQAMLHFDVNDIEDDYSNYLYHLNQYKELDSVLKSLGVVNDLHIGEITKEEDCLLDFLVDIFKSNPECKIDKDNIGVRRIVIGNVGLMVVLYEQNGLPYVKSLFDPTLGMTVERKLKKKKIKESIFGVLTKDDYLEISNIPYSEIIHSYDIIRKDNPYVATNLNNIGLILLSAYDEMSDVDIRKRMIGDTVLDIFDYLPTIEDSEESQTMFFINKCQMLRRIDGLEPDFEQRLNSIMFSCTTSPVAKCAAAMLLNNKHIFDHYWVEVPEDEKLSLKSFPIWKFSFNQ